MKALLAQGAIGQQDHCCEEMRFLLRRIRTPTWSENRCEVCGSKSLKTRLVRHVSPAHSLDDVAALHNYLASILSRFLQTGRKRFQQTPDQRRSDLSAARTMKII